jgi:hypothetical protein
MTEAFKKKQPNINVLMEIAPWQTVDQQLLQAAGAGRGPDVVRIYSPNLPIHVAAGSIIPLDGFFDYWTKEQREDFGKSHAGVGHADEDLAAGSAGAVNDDSGSGALLGSGDVGLAECYGVIGEELGIDIGSVFLFKETAQFIIALLYAMDFFGLRTR